ncbi:cytochrome P450 3A30 isoform X1 [Octopus bimaculoides]|nr:cytochrome P450 3A30 isoform X1 [Octopus bimaculoides]|eukprot:XP_014775105.1 PREDICTED: cytochrome P450 3A30-like isoform X1 [Octopus bimaculoides]
MLLQPRYLLEKEWCKKFGSVTGYFIGRSPYLLITDLQMIKTIMSTNFANFRNRPFDVPTDDFTELFLMNTKDQYWKFLRTLMMTAFSNKKLREALYLMKVCVANFATNISQNAANGKEFCINQYCSSYTMDIIAATGFGIEINSQMNMNHPFVLHAKALFKPGFLKYLIALTFVFPFLWHLVNIYIILAGERKHRNFFAAICRDTILFRRNNPEIVPNKDILQTMLEAQANLQGAKTENQDGSVTDQYDLSDKQIIAQATMFLLAAYENTANTIAFLAYQLALNPDIQNRIYEEITETVEGDVTFENLQQLKYLDMCLAEVLRLYPVSPRTNRIAAKESVIQGWTIPTEADVVFPIYTIHHDPEIWPEPEKFDPERFRAENSEGRHPYSYLPFGGGPRMCMGPKFAQLESKLAIVEILRSYELLPCERTEIPVELDDNFLLAPKNGIWLKVEKRKDI